jgi:hypothetical protein
VADLGTGHALKRVVRFAFDRCPLADRTLPVSLASDSHRDRRSAAGPVVEETPERPLPRAVGRAGYLDPTRANNRAPPLRPSWWARALPVHPARFGSRLNRGRAEGDPSQTVSETYVTSSHSDCCTAIAIEPHVDPLAALVANLTPEQRQRLAALLAEQREGDAC